MSIAEVIPFRAPDPQVKEVIVDTEDKNNGYTPLPNFICDEGYLAVLDGDAIKCLILLNRHINGFHLENKSMSETLIKKITGIKDGRTIQKYTASLVQLKLIKVEKEKGKSNVYYLTFDDRLPTCHVGTIKKTKPQINHKAPTSNVGTLNEPPTQHVSTPPTSNVGGSTYMACGSVKEIDLKENIKKDEEEARAKFQPQNRQLNFIEYHVSDREAISLKNLFQKYPGQVDFYDQAKISFPDHSHEQIVTELRKLAQWSLSAGNHMPQKWMNIWLNWMQKIPTQSELAAAEARKQQKSQTPKAEKPKRVSRFGKYLKPQQPQQGEIYDV